MINFYELVERPFSGDVGVYNDGYCATKQRGKTTHINVSIIINVEKKY